MASSNNAVPQIDQEGIVVRTWTAKATQAGAERYCRYFAETLLPQVRKLQGFAGGYLLSRELTQTSPSGSGGGEMAMVELTTHTFWESMDAVHAFANGDFEASVVEPEAQACLLEYDRTATHRSLLIDGRSWKRQ